MMMSVLSFFLGRPLASGEEKGQKINVLWGLPAMGLDGLSSASYGPEAALAILLPAGMVGLHYIGPITLVILCLLAMLYLSYRQTIAAYPVNGGSYTVARENLGTWASLFAASALMIDYVLTAAVGISAGIGALVSAAPALEKYTVPLCLLTLGVITAANLRGTAEAGAAFALPTYLFIVSLLVVLAIGVCRAIAAHGHPHAVVSPPPVPAAAEAVSVWLLLRSFASGCTAMTGVEAVSNGVSAFEEPRVKNAHRTLTAIVMILAVLLGGIAYLARAYQIAAMDQSVSGYQSVLSQIVAAVVGRNWLYYVTIGSVLTVLCLSANTSFVDFPRLCRLIAKDEFLPVYFASVGRRLVYSTGVLFLAISAGLLLVGFRGITNRLIPLYAVGAFLAFTLSQTGMVVHWLKQSRGQGGTNRDSGRAGMTARLAVNATGAVATGAALAIILIAKFTEGAWITILAIPMLLTIFWFVHRRYQWIDRSVECNHPLDLSGNDRPVVLLPIRGWSRLTQKSLRFALRLSDDVVAVHLTNLEGDAAEDEALKMRQQWSRDVETPAREAGAPIPRLDFARTPYREFVAPMLHQIQQMKNTFPHRPIAVIIPELIEKHWFYAILHTRKAAHLRKALRDRQDFRVVIVEIPWFVDLAVPESGSANPSSKAAAATHEQNLK
jgi:amino acid transporter